MEIFNEWGYCSKCGELAFIPQFQDNTKCYDCLGIGFSKTKKTNIYKKQPIPKYIRRIIFERDGYKCKQCGTNKNLHADHIIPEVRGGQATIENLQTLCKSCNSRKGTK